MLHHWTGTSVTTQGTSQTVQKTSIMAHPDGMNDTDDTSGEAAQTHTDGMAHR